MPPEHPAVLYTLQTNSLDYDGFQVETVVIGVTEDIDTAVENFAETRADVEPLDRWRPNPDLEVSDSEEGIHELAELYATEKEGAFYTFVQDQYSDFATMVSRFLSSASATDSGTDLSAGGSQSTPDLGEYGVVFAYQGTPVRELSGKNQTDVMIAATNYLMEEHDLAGELEIPWVPARRKAVINDTPEWPRADPVYKELANGLYLDTKINREGKQREIGRMAKMCDLSVRYSGDWS